MAKGPRPAPLNLSLVSRPKSLPTVERQQSFSPEMKQEISRLLSPLPEDEYEDPPDPLLRAVRMAVDFLHIVGCLLLVSILVTFLAKYTRAFSSTYGAQMTLLLVALIGDVMLDVASLRLCSRTWGGWTLLARTLAAAIYLGLLTAFVVTGKVLPADYKLWNLSGSDAAAPVLSILSVVLGWDIVHLVFSRWRVSQPCSWVNLATGGQRRIALAHNHNQSRRGRFPGRTLRSV